jgi:hypothetical protein
VTAFDAGDDDYLVKRVLGTFDVPAYVKRGLRLEADESALLGRCASLRDKKLLRIRLAVLACWQAVERVEDLSPHCAGPADYEYLLQLAGLVEPERRPLTMRPISVRRIGRRLEQLVAECRRFNQVWQHVIESVDLGPINTMIADYNKFGLLERECAMRSARLAAHGFQARRPWTRADLHQHFSLLPVPRLREPTK